MSLIHFSSGLKWECINRWTINSTFPCGTSHNRNGDNISCIWSMLRNIPLDISTEFFYMHFCHCTIYINIFDEWAMFKTFWGKKTEQFLSEQTQKIVSASLKFSIRCYEIIKTHCYQTNPISPNPSKRITRRNGGCVHILGSTLIIHFILKSK